uniref:Uncharacterized protein n=1 Tax=Ananas comosus var. bracteatus TaxID=296719 RepID=A0A6V7Q6X5_ANACO|nr:unnamed protein product [Ananas comosus var. bracteatus]
MLMLPSPQSYTWSAGRDLLLRLTFDNICGLAFDKDPEMLSPGLPENAFAVAFDRATEATLQRFIFPKFVWQFKKRLQFGMETTLASSVAHVDHYLSAVIKARKLELVSRFMKKGERRSPAPSTSFLSLFLSRHDDILFVSVALSLSSSIRFCRAERHATLLARFEEALGRLRPSELHPRLRSVGRVHR